MQAVRIAASIRTERVEHDDLATLRLDAQALSTTIGVRVGRVGSAMRSGEVSLPAVRHVGHVPEHSGQAVDKPSLGHLEHVSALVEVRVPVVIVGAVVLAILIAQHLGVLLVLPWHARKLGHPVIKALQHRRSRRQKVVGARSKLFVLLAFVLIHERNLTRGHMRLALADDVVALRIAQKVRHAQHQGL
eukprot:CAMPEP_0205910654 /NCGR_PEP_ID=MMETSP1325-20131115/4578_1 /ASSEMBLY_ACC=CAM_ASM_000708 /TAXON_ID=236786 /ORGANISM="Florenciella sp., Strain RCC1007" /LENGTH=188 /DNA_ID=CAMNT_0053277041 /DNA_START=248 /DNA_END=814 /DNA_ORIENTATION=-